MDLCLRYILETKLIEPNGQEPSGFGISTCVGNRIIYFEENSDSPLFSYVIYSIQHVFESAKCIG